MNKEKFVICYGPVISTPISPEPTPGPWDKITHLFTCENCEFSFATPPVEYDKLGNFYKEKFRKNTRENIKIERSVSEKLYFRGLTQVQLCRMFYNYEQNVLNKVLDIGAGYGYTLNSFNKLIPSNKRHAIEPSETTNATYTS